MESHVILRTGIRIVVVLVVSVAIPKTKKSLHGPKLDELVDVDILFRLDQVEALLGLKNLSKFFCLGPLFLRMLVLCLDIFNCLWIKICDCALLELSRIIPKIPFNEWTSN